MYETEKAELQTKAQGVKQIPQQLDKLGVLLEELDKSIYSLEEELKSVLSTSVVQANEAKEMKAEQLVPLGGLIRERCNHVEAMIQRVGYLHASLQI